MAFFQRAKECLFILYRGGHKLIKPNYKSQKRQKELARQEKKELKRKRKESQKADESDIQQDQNHNTITPPEAA
jgi:hypothetical protein